MENDSVLIVVLRNTHIIIFLAIVAILIYLQINYRKNQLDISQSLLKYQKELLDSQSAIFEL